MINKTVIIFSAGRTGSTLIFQVLKSLFSEVIKAHDLQMKNGLFDSGLDCIVTTRDCVDSYLSKLRVVESNGCEKHFLKNIQNKNYLYSNIIQYKKELDYVRYVLKNYKGKILELEYEKFYDDYDYIFSNLESFFNITIDSKDRSRITLKTSRESNKTIQKKFCNFSEHDTESHIHGNHIFSHNAGSNLDLISAKDKARIFKLLSE